MHARLQVQVWFARSGSSCMPADGALLPCCCWLQGAWLPRLKGVVEQINEAFGEAFAQVPRACIAFIVTFALVFYTGF